MIQSVSQTSSSFRWTSIIIGFVWSLLTGCFAILNIYIFVQPQWIGDTLSSPRAGYFGLYSYCISENNDFEFDCQGTWTNFRTIVSVPFIIATFFVGLSVLLIVTCLTLFLLFFCFRARFVYFICACLQTCCAISLLVALIVYPFGLDNDAVREVCGVSVTKYYLNTCQIRWAYILGIVGFFNATILALLALFLASKQIESEMMTEVTNPMHLASNYGKSIDNFEDRTISESNKSTAVLYKQ